MNKAIINEIDKHYRHEKKKRPYFCDLIQRQWCGRGKRPHSPTELLEKARRQLANNIFVGRCSAFDVLTCELYELAEAAANGDTKSAIGEAYDTIAVLLRFIDVFEGRQKFGATSKEWVGALHIAEAKLKPIEDKVANRFAKAALEKASGEEVANG